MRKLLLLAVVTLIGFNTNAQDGFRAGINAGVPVGDFSDFLSFSISLDLSYDWEVSEGINVGIISGINYNFGKDEFDDVKYAPVAVMGRFNISDQFELGGDVGYAISLESGGSGDFYFRPVISYNVNETTDISASYANVIGDGSTLSSFNIGVGFRF